MARTARTPVSAPARVVAPTQRLPYHIGAWRRYRQLTLVELATRAGITHGTLSRYESGRTRPPAWRLHILARALGLNSAGDLYRLPGAAGDADAATTLAHRIAALPPEKREAVIKMIEAFTADK